MEKVGSMKIDMSKIDLDSVPTTWRDGKMYWKLVFELKIGFGRKKGVLDVSSWADGKKVGTTSLSYGKNS